MEAIDGGANHRPAALLEANRQLVGERGFSGRVEPIDRHAHRMIAPLFGDAISKLSQELRACHQY